MKKFLVIKSIVAAVLLGLASWVFILSRTSPSEVKSTPTSSPQSHNLDLTIELASTPEQQRSGLMNRTELCDDCGMLFDFEEEQPRLSFWMKNTLIPLDILFLDSSGKINTIHIGTIPKDTALFYDSSKPSQYALELNAGRSEELDLEVGDTINLELLLASALPYGGEN